MVSKESQKGTRSQIRYDILGSTAIIEVRGNRKDEKKAAKNLMQFDSRIKTILVKAGPVSGEYRTRKLRYVLGIKKYNVEYKENGCIFAFDPRKTFFSSRLSFERSRILSLSKDGENVIVMFSGIGPFAIEIAKKNKNSNVAGIESNPYASKCMEKNIKSNKLTNAISESGDVRKFSKKYANFADRIIMPLPWSSMEFLDVAEKMAGPQCTIHIYVFGKTETVLKDSWKKIREHARKSKFSTSMLSSRTVRTYSSSEIEIVIDYLLKKKKR